MEYKFLDSSIITEDFVLPESDGINRFLLKNHNTEILKALDFLASEEKFLYIHGYLGTGKRQFINYISEFLTKEVITLEYHCKQSTVCDDILLAFIDHIEKSSMSKAVLHSAKITTLAVKFKQYLSSIKKPFVIIIHSFDSSEENNEKLISEALKQAVELENVKIIISTRAMLQDILGEVKPDRKIFLKPFTKEVFNEYVKSAKVQGTDSAYDDFYKYTRGYYYYTALTLKIIQAMQISINDFLSKFVISGMSYEEYLGVTYINLIPNTIRNFFWFLRFIRHGISLNALAVLELYDEFSINYLKSNLMIFQHGEVLFVQDYFQQDIDISIPAKTEIKLHKYIISIYEKELKQPLQEREILISRQALRSEIDYHTNCISDIENNKKTSKSEKEEIVTQKPEKEEDVKTDAPDSIGLLIQGAQKLVEEKKYTEALERFQNIINEGSIDSNTLAEIRISMARVYKEIGEYPKAQHYYELAEAYYKQNEEFINLNYLYYELTDLYVLMYKTERAIETIKKVIYSVDTPQSLMVDSCTILGNIYSDEKNSDEAYKYYQKALESLDENTPNQRKAELFFKYALACDDNDDWNAAFEYYTKCLMIKNNNPYMPLAYSNLGVCYFDNGNDSDALYCFNKAHDMEKDNNNYDGIYFTSSYLAKIFAKTHSERSYEYLKEAKQSAEFINDDFCILESTVALGDYYYNKKDTAKEALIEYLKARKVAQNIDDTTDIKKVEERIQDMKRRMPKEDFDKIEKKYG